MFASEENLRKMVDGANDKISVIVEELGSQLEQYGFRPAKVEVTLVATVHSGHTGTATVTRSEKFGFE